MTKKIFEHQARVNRTLPLEEREIILGYIRGKPDFAPVRRSRYVRLQSRILA